MSMSNPGSLLQCPHFGYFINFCCHGVLLLCMPNARHQAWRTVGARDERTLFAVACMPLFGLLGAKVLGFCRWFFRTGSSSRSP
jgi:hypothetical protein